MNLKTVISGVIIAMSASVVSVAQENAVRFNVLPLEGDGMTANVASTIQRKLVSAFDRSKASTESPYNVFAVKVQYDITKANESEGLVRNVASVDVDMTLSAVNLVDEEIYYTTTIPLSATDKGGTDAALKKIANSIKVNDPVYVRFIRNARKRITDYYAENCGVVIEKARRLVQLKQFNEAASYLSAISPEVACYDDAAVLVGEIVPYLPNPEGIAPDTVIIDRVVEVPTTPDTVVVDRVVEVPVAQPEPQAPVAPAPVAPTIERPNIIIDDNLFDFDVVDCEGDLSRQSIVITVVMKNRNKNANEGWVSVVFFNAIDEEGNELKKLAYRDGSDQYIRLPYNVERRTYFSISNVYDRFSKLSYAEFRINGIKVKVSNLTINWK